MRKVSRNGASGAAKRSAEPVHPGERTSPEGKAVANSLLLAIPDDEFRVIRPHLQFVCLPQRSSLHEAEHETGRRLLSEYRDGVSGFHDPRWGECRGWGSGERRLYADSDRGRLPEKPSLRGHADRRRGI